MDDISTKNEILRAASAQHTTIEALPESHANEIREQLLRRYAKDQRYELNCNNIADYVAVQHPDSWRWIEGYLGEEPVLFFYDDDRDCTIFRVRSGRDLIKILEECYAFVYYATNENLEYLVCHNDHDYILGAGSAKPWVESLAPRHEEWARSLRSLRAT